MNQDVLPGDADAFLSEAIGYLDAFDVKAEETLARLPASMATIRERVRSHDDEGAAQALRDVTMERCSEAQV